MTQSDFYGCYAKKYTVGKQEWEQGDHLGDYCNNPVKSWQQQWRIVKIGLFSSS